MHKERKVFNLSCENLYFRSKEKKTKKIMKNFNKSRKRDTEEIV